MFSDGEKAEGQHISQGSGGGRERDRLVPPQVWRRPVAAGQGGHAQPGERVASRHLGLPLAEQALMTRSFNGI